MKIRRFNENTEQPRLKIKTVTKTILHIQYKDLIEYMKEVYKFDLETMCCTSMSDIFGEEFIVTDEESVSEIRNNVENYDDYTIYECLSTLCDDGYIPPGTYVIHSYYASPND